MKLSTVGKTYNILQNSTFFKQYYKLFGSPFIHYHVCYRYIEKFLKKNYTQQHLKTLKVVDFGCGDGIYLNQMSMDFGIKGLGIDIMQERIHIAQQISNLNKLGNNFQINNIENIQVNDKYDLGICFDVLEHIDPNNYKLVMSKISNTIVKGGKFLIRVPYKEDRNYIKSTKHNFTYGKDAHLKKGFDEAELANMLEKNGFKIINISYNFYWLAQIMYELQEPIRRYNKIMYALLSILTRYISLLETIKAFNGTPNGILIVGEKI